MMYSNNKKAAQGIGTLIIFISLILVSAIAAAVLISTASSLQSKALDVGRQSQERLTTAIEVFQVKATDVSDGMINNTDMYQISLRLQAGSTPIKLNDTLIRIDSDNVSQTLSYHVGAPTHINFNATYPAGVPNNVGYIQQGELVTLNALGLDTIMEENDISIKIINDNGAPIPVDITMPSVMVNTFETLYP